MEDQADNPPTVTTAPNLERLTTKGTEWTSEADAAPLVALGATARSQEAPVRASVAGTIAEQIYAVPVV